MASSNASPLEMLAQTCQNIGSDKIKNGSNTLPTTTTSPIMSSAQSTVTHTSLKRGYDSISSRLTNSQTIKSPSEKREKVNDEHTGHKVTVRKTYSPPIDIVPTKYQASSNALAELAKFSSNLVLSNNQKSTSLTQMPQSSPKRMVTPNSKSKVGRSGSTRYGSSSSPVSISPNSQLNIPSTTSNNSDPLSSPMSNITNIVEQLTKSDDMQGILYQLLLREYFDSLNKKQPVKREIANNLMAKFCMYCGKKFDNQSNLLFHVYAHLMKDEDNGVPHNDSVNITTGSSENTSTPMHSDSDNVITSEWMKFFMSEEYQHLFKQNTGNNFDYTSDFMNYFWPMMAQNVNFLCDKTSMWPLEKSL